MIQIGLEQAVWFL